MVCEFCRQNLASNKKKQDSVEEDPVELAVLMGDAESHNLTLAEEAKEKKYSDFPKETEVINLTRLQCMDVDNCHELWDSLIERSEATKKSPLNYTMEIRLNFHGKYGEGRTESRELIRKFDEHLMKNREGVPETIKKGSKLFLKEGVGTLTGQSYDFWGLVGVPYVHRAITSRNVSIRVFEDCLTDPEKPFIRVVLCRGDRDIQTKSVDCKMLESAKSYRINLADPLNKNKKRRLF